VINNNSTNINKTNNYPSPQIIDHIKDNDTMIYADGNLGALMMRLYHVNLVLGRSHKTSQNGEK
jgi:hypothetical protein